ncbi:DUF3168 domain-containing protein [Aureimonas fodinaquatilis]|uniref:DUF3168 domain-containing protein n=1 Tax=Aureimonas fodinaquatilis TaxID=2565783 RepID=A0A5B0DYY5_9HYPH|nr:DUF3168 domain-containing protein [Aureimonas fodinaquatilis]KAA0971065.1 DUF3168 domain-containing protein [Aureimonas fodinaquatilis]
MPHSDARLETAIVDRLVGDQTLTNMLGGPKVFEHMANRASFPYLTLGCTSVIDWSRGLDDGSEFVLTLHIWAGSEGKAETFEIMNTVSERLHESCLPLEGEEVARLFLEFAQARQEPESINYHGILRFRAVRQLLA